MDRRRWSFALVAASLLAVAASTGCTTCQSCDDYCGSYYGGRTGDWVHASGRAGSIHSHTAASAVVDDSGSAIIEEPADSYYP